jgi:hypothetical protein
MNEKQDMKQIFDRHLSSLHFHAVSCRTVMDRVYEKEEPATKKKMSVTLVVALVLTLTIVAALAAVVVMHSDTASKVNLAREALYEKYDLTPQTLGMFVYESHEENGKYTLIWTCDTYHPSLTGIYTTVVKDGVATASWSYDDVDKSVYDSGDLSAPVWGYRQLEAAFKNKEAASEYSLALYQQDDENGTSAVPYVTPEPLDDGEQLWQGEILRAAEPGANDLPVDQAYEIAVQALIEDFDLDRESIDEGYIECENFLARENGGTLWDISIYVTIDDIQEECVVRLDGASGEILSIDVSTGGNG